MTEDTTLSAEGDKLREAAIKAFAVWHRHAMTCFITKPESRDGFLAGYLEGYAAAPAHTDRRYTAADLTTAVLGDRLRGRAKFVTPEAQACLACDTRPRSILVS